MLATKGFEIEEEAKLDGGTDPEQQEFIMDVMEARTSLEEADSEEEIARIRTENKGTLCHAVF